MQAAKYTEAAATLSRCMELDPRNGECHRLYANVLIQLGEPERAEEHMRQYLHNIPTERPADLPSKPLVPFGGSQSPH